jgi:hypothetical protein
VNPGDHPDRAAEYRRVAAEMERAPQFVTELNEVLTLHKLLDRVKNGRPEYCYSYVRCLKTALEDPKSRCTDGKMAFYVTEGEKKRLRRTRMQPDQWEGKYDWSPGSNRPFPVDQVWPGQFGKALSFDGIEVNRHWQNVPPFILVRLEPYTVWAHQYGFLCRRYPAATWHAPWSGFKHKTPNGPLCLVERSKVVAIVMHTNTL